MQRLILLIGALALVSITTGCADDDPITTPAPTCSPACGACQQCDTSDADAPVCVDMCGSDSTCQDGKCVGATVATCDPACSACQQCDTSGETPVCTDICATGTTCEDSKCVAPDVVTCDPVCGDCEMCDTSGATPTCKGLCGTGLSCESGACVAAADPCAGKCSSCETCDTTHGVPYCMNDCPAGASCDTTKNVCRPSSSTAFDHSSLPELAGPFTADVAGGKAVTAKCLSCHASAGTQVMSTAHWNWLGDTPNLSGTTATKVGKQNLVNNFCVAVPSNEKRCAQCHAGYGYVDNTFDFTDSGNIDCLVCHSTNYKKGKKTGGAPDTTVDVALAAQSVGLTTRATCGRCHFSAGGGDNVKKGDIGSPLGSPAVTTDVHMGAASNPFTCTSCHVATGHRIPGQGVHLPVQEGRIGCVDCHSAEPHSNDLTNNHALDIACQTCHVPAFSRQMPTKMDWDWSTAGNKSRGTDGVETSTVGGDTVQNYNYLKGDFVWEKTVRPSYAWYDGRVTRMTLEDSYPAGKGTTTDRIDLGGPIATFADETAKIYPFKVMKGRQPVDTTSRKIIAPKLFGPGGFWGAIPAAADYTAQGVEDLWTSSNTAGALYAGQLNTGESYSGRATGNRPWDWAYTEMWMGINHEVAQKASALGCASCHGASSDEWDWKALGYSCDPMNDAVGCGSRNR